MPPGGHSKRPGERNSALYTAVCRGDAALVAKLLKSKRGGQRDGRAAAAAAAGAPAALDLEELSRGSTALHAACGTGQPRIVAMLIEAGANPNTVRPKDGYTPLLIAVETGERDIVKALLEAKADPNLSSHVEGVAPLHVAAAQGMTEIALDLLRAGANQLQPTLGKLLRPIHYASFSGHVEILELLVEAAAAAACDDGERACKLLLQLSDARGQQPLQCAVRDGARARDTVLALLGMGAEVDGGTLGPAPTPLMIAAMKVLPAVAKVLVEAGANVNARHADGETVLHMSARMCDAATAGLLLAGGADRFARNRGGLDADALLRMPVTSIRPVHMPPPTKAEEEAFGRLLVRAPALRASSWRWPVRGGGGSCSDAVRHAPTSATTAFPKGLDVLVRRSRSDSRQQHSDNRCRKDGGWVPLSSLLWR